MVCFNLKPSVIFPQLPSKTSRLNRIRQRSVRAGLRILGRELGLSLELDEAQDVLRNLLRRGGGAKNVAHIFFFFF